MIISHRDNPFVYVTILRHQSNQHSDAPKQATVGLFFRKWAQYFVTCYRRVVSYFFFAILQWRNKLVNFLGIHNYF